MPPKVIERTPFFISSSVIPSLPISTLAPFVALFKAPFNPVTPLATSLGKLALRTSLVEVLDIPVVDAIIPPKEPSLVS